MRKAEDGCKEFGLSDQKDAIAVHQDGDDLGRPGFVGAKQECWCRCAELETAGHARGDRKETYLSWAGNTDMEGADKLRYLKP